MTIISLVSSDSSASDAFKPIDEDGDIKGPIDVPFNTITWKTSQSFNVGRLKRT